MSLIAILIGIIIFGIILSIVNFYVPMDGKIKTLLNVVAAIMVIACLLNALGFIGTPVFTHMGAWHLRQ